MGGLPTQLRAMLGPIHQQLQTLSEEMRQLRQIAGLNSIGILLETSSRQEEVEMLKAQLQQMQAEKLRHDENMEMLHV